MAGADSDDPVYSKSTFLTSYMSNHADTLVAYICYHLGQQSKRAKGGKVPPTEAKDVKDPRMLKITSNEMELQYKDAKDGLAVKTVTVPFDPPLAGYEEVRPRLLQMKLEAENAIGMAKKPPISVYRTPTRRNALIVISLLLLWIGCATQENDYGSFGRIRRLAGGWWTIRATGMMIVVLHSAEAAFQFRSCQRFSMPMQQTLLWTFTTFILGFASLLEFRKVVREARIASVGKTH
ncbi:hypothetical protein P389DRAFT_148149 [Cystobasidium minutum MCA 4210]|uniref:uncharacterized protein n=1 Tax=Cystobasidium minutum MCA 4210 TaxID=1397322 RepID=UPI0034CD93DF|eukprot:jgi/Rhomi1/148149/e_gw1.11.104.1